MSALLRQVVTFARDRRRGNPAFVLGVEDFPDLATLRMACDLLRTDVLAVVARPDDPEPALRFVTRSGPHAGAGHAALAATHLAFERRPASEVFAFLLDDGQRLRARRTAQGISIDWPAMAYTPFADLDVLGAALGSRPAAALQAPFGIVAIYGAEPEVAALAPDMARTAGFGRALIATAPGARSDIVVRVFAPHAGLPEDPVCGTAHRIIVPFWSQRLSRAAIHSRHLSSRGGELFCTWDGDAVSIAGESICTIEGTMDLGAGRIG